MFFQCVECSTKYKIDDEKIFKKVLKFKCRTCGSSLVIRDPALGKPYVSLEADFVKGKLYRRITESSSEIARKFQKERRPTSQITPVPHVTPHPVPEKKVLEHWYAIKKGEKIGPLTLDNMRDLFLGGQIHERSFVWKPQMKGWTRLKEIPELKEFLEEVSQKKKLVERDKTVVDEEIVQRAQKLMKEKEPVREEIKEKSPAPHRIETKQVEIVEDLWAYLREPEKLQKESAEIKKEEIVEKEKKGEDIIADTTTEKKFFSTAFALEEREVPKVEEKFFPEISISEEKKGDKEEAIRLADLSPVKDLRAKKPSKKEIKSLIQEFSVMIRLERKTKKQKFIFAGVGILLVAVISFIVIKIQEESELRSREMAEEYRTELYKKGKLKRGLYEIENESVENNQSEKRKIPEKEVKEFVKRKEKPKENNYVKPENLHDGGPLKKEEKSPAISPELKEKYAFYSDMLNGISLKKDEVKLEVKPQTTVKKDTSTLTPEGINDFLAQKFKKFADCKRRSKYKSPYPVKIILTFTVNSDGRVDKVNVEESGMQDEPLNACLKGIIQTWIFPSINEPITFKRIIML